MIKSIVGFMVAILLLGAANAEPVSEAVAKTIKDNLKAARPDLSFGAVETSPIDGLYIVRVNGTQFVYANQTGEYLITGDMYHASSRTLYARKRFGGSSYPQGADGRCSQGRYDYFSSRG